MKIISWNCNGKFRSKFKEIEKEDADIYVIQECENPEITKENEYKKFATNYIWVGEKNNKGLGIFAKENIKLEKNNWDTYCLRNFLSVRINNEFDLIGVWACKPYIEEYYIYQYINFKKYNSDTIIIGDFNSNKIWDTNNNVRNHMNVVNQLLKKELVSAYHTYYNEEQGEETQKTFYLYKHLDKGYHIDHCFIKKDRIKKYQILFDENWLKYSDHMPVILESKK